MRRVYFWQGEPVKVEFGLSRLTTNEEKPLYWYNYECAIKPWSGERNDGVCLIPSIRVTIDMHRHFVIANHYGIGAHKLRNGGWPNYAHFSIPDEGFDPVTGKRDAILFNATKLDLAGYEAYEAARKAWQKENFPEEYNKLQQLKNSFKQFNKKK